MPLFAYYIDIFCFILQIAYDVVSILQHLAHSPLGSLLMKDFRRQQFVIVGDTLKLSDVDDIVLGDPKCISDKDCILEAKSGKHVKSYRKYLDVSQKCCNDFSYRCFIDRSSDLLV